MGQKNLIIGVIVWAILLVLVILFARKYFENIQWGRSDTIWQKKQAHNSE